MSWTGAARAEADGEFRCDVQIRAHADPVPATARVSASAESTRDDATIPGVEWSVIVDEPLVGVAPGQTAVVYVGTRVLGQFTIDRTVSAVQSDETVAGEAKAQSADGQEAA